jgi:hypothetical protein
MEKFEKILVKGKFGWKDDKFGRMGGWEDGRMGGWEGSSTINPLIFLSSYPPILLSSI